MKVTSQQIYDMLLTGINQQMQTQNTATAQISSGMRFTRPSQDGAGYKKSIDIRHMQSSIGASLTAISTAKSRLGASQNALSSIMPILQRAQAIAVQEANAGLTSADRQAAAAEVSTLQNELLAITNKQFEGESLFSGTATGTAAYSSAFSAGNVQYTQGQNTSITVSQTANPTAVNDTYTITVDAATGTSITSVKDSSGTEQLAGFPASVGFGPGAGNTAVSLNNGVTLSVNYSGSAQLVADGGTVTVTSAGAAGTLHYVGNTLDRAVAITPTQTVQTNVRADSTAFTEAFSSMKALYDSLVANNTAGIQSSINQLKTAGDDMAQLTAEVGGRLNSVTLQEQSYKDFKMQTDQLLSQNESVDIPATMTKLTQAQTALQATYSEVSRMSNLSLVNYLK